MMIESERTRSVAFWSGRLSMPTSRMFLVPLIVTCCCGWPGSSSWVWLKLLVAAAKISFWPMMTVPLPSMMSAPKITSSLAHSGSFGGRPGPVGEHHALVADLAEPAERAGHERQVVATQVVELQRHVLQREVLVHGHGLGDRVQEGGQLAGVGQCARARRFVHDRPEEL